MTVTWRRVCTVKNVFNFFLNSKKKIFKMLTDTHYYIFTCPVVFEPVKKFHINTLFAFCFYLFYLIHDFMIFRLIAVAKPKHNSRWRYCSATVATETEKRSRGRTFGGKNKENDFV